MSDLSWLRLILVGFSLVIVGPDASAAGQPASDARPFQIYMIQWRGPTETDRGFTEYFEQEGISATFIVRNADREAESIPTFVKEIKELQPDLVYVWGGAAPPLVVGRYDAVDPTRHVVDIPVVAIGGVTELADVLDYLAVGAAAVQVGTAIFADPTLPVRLVDELEAECRRRGLDSYAPLIGTALPRKPGAPSSKGVEYRP